MRNGVRVSSSTPPFCKRIQLHPNRFESCGFDVLFLPQLLALLEEEMKWEGRPSSLFWLLLLPNKLLLSLKQRLYFACDLWAGKLERAQPGGSGLRSIMQLQSDRCQLGLRSSEGSSGLASREAHSCVFSGHWLMAGSSAEVVIQSVYI